MSADEPAVTIWVVVWEWDGSEIFYDGPFTAEAGAEEWADFIESNLSPVEVKVVAFNADDAMETATDEMRNDILRITAN